ncbi:MmgE/PrpD family protein [Variovorax sp. WS11]|uniref:MmgE/PrpD family protein n=1 Tax=Variovorax sp. WS11 TaxID=1105204 RepID=UPI000D0D92FD|nr:MmgE/PrpD family protein [Variovorax sp. WS11]NDZ18755.1 MmgE/PrpD family protein [Variovorax sp. WS11]PSL82534.1 MmgE/PrpD family protein [Variovorax sp. WS11]
MDAIFDISKTLANIRFDQLSPAAVRMTKNSILDTLGVTLAGSTIGAGCKEVVELVTDCGGKPESSILGLGGRVPAPMAAFANGAMSHSLDFDDIDDVAAVHPGVATVPAGFAMAERIGKVPGKDFITAICMGADLLLRLGYAGRRGQGGFRWLPGQIYGGFAATATCGKLLHFDESQLVDAFGIALMQACGSYEPIRGTGSVIRGLWPAFTSQAGVLSSLMAQRGISGSKNSLEGQAALFQAYLGGEYDRHYLVDGLGEHFFIADSGFKPWPCSGINKPYIEATLNLVRDHRLRPQDIEDIEVTVADMGQLLCEPLAERQNPKTPMDAKWSIPFAVAVAALRGTVKIADFTPAGIQDPDVLRLARKVKPRFDASLAPAGGGWTGVPPGVVEIRTTSGERHACRVDVALGYGVNPMTLEHHVEKFRDCASYSAKPLSAATVDAVIGMVHRLEELDDVGEVVRLLS